MLRYLASLGFRVRANLDLIISLSLAAILIYLLSLAATSGPNSGATFADDSSVGTITWGSTGNAASSNNAYATASLDDNQISHYLKATNFGFSIPSGSTINGITVEVEKKAANASRIEDYRVRIIKGGTIGTTDRANTGVFWGTTDAYTTYGGASDLWGQTWTSTDINSSNFGVAFSAYKNATAGNAITASVDHIRITVSYTPPNSAPNAPTLVSPANGSTTSDTTPTLSANYSDIDAGDTGTTNYRIATSASNCLAGTVVASGTSSATASNNQNTTWTPLSSIGSDATYYWCAQNDDGVLTSSWTSMGNFILDTTGPTVTEVTPVANPTNDTTPNYTFNTTEAGSITYGGDCTSATTSAVSGNNTVTFSALSAGLHNNCTVRVTDSVGNLSNILNVTAFTIDITAPTLTQVTPVPSLTNDNTPNYTFNSTEAGTITYGGDCSSATTSAVSGNNTVTFNTLADGAHSNCTIKVTDAAGNQSANLNVNSFTVDTSAPTLAEVTPVPATTNDTTPNYTFSSTEAGNITYGGDCSSATTSAVSGNNTVTFNALSAGLHNNCTIKVTDAAGNQSANLNVSSFTIDTTSPTLSEVTPVTTPTSDTTPNYTFSSTEAGSITYGGDCSSATTSAISGNNTVTFNALSAGLHNNCTIQVTDSAGNPSNTLNVTAFTIDTTAPVLTEVTPVTTPTNDNTPSYTFNTTKAGTITYGGGCSGATTSAVSGNNTIDFGPLSDGNYNCTLSVTDTAGNVSTNLNVTAFTIDTVLPVLAQVTAVPSLTNDNTPNYTFSSTEAGSITYGGDCSSATTSAISGNNTVTFNTLADGAHSNCTIKVTDVANNQSANLNVNSFTIDTLAPTLAEVTPVPVTTNDNTPNYTFSSTESGSITYGGDCSSVTTSAVIGNNTVTFNILTDGLHNNCTINVTDTATNLSSTLNVSAFTVDTTPPPGPTISEVTPVPNPTSDTTPNYTFSSNEAGTITYGGDCSSATTAAVAGNNTVTFNSLSEGLHNNCTILVTNILSAPSNLLNVSAFSIDTTPPTVTEVTPVTSPTNDNTPSYTFNTTEGGNITYGGSCSSATAVAITGNNTVTFNTLADGTYSNCTIKVTDAANNQSSNLNVSSFTIDTTAPVISEVTPVPTPGSNATPSYTFNSSEAGGITYGGDCSSATTLAATGLNTVVFNALADGSHNNCTITVTDATLNVSNLLNVSAFVIDTVVPSTVSDLTALSPTTTSITLAWTAPGNNGPVGTASSYEIRYSTSPINIGNFTSATLATGIPLPQSAGSAENMVVNGLASGTTYYFALMAQDNAGNNSALSNVVSETTVAAPVVIPPVVVTPEPKPVGVGAVGGVGAGSCSGSQCARNLKSITYQIQSTISNTIKNRLLNCRRNQNTPITFTDIANDPNRTYIEDMFRKCIVDGKSEDKFEPNGAITRAEFLKVVLNYFDLGTSEYKNTYSDVSKNDWFAQYVAKAVELKLISMGSNFNPHNNITRVEALKILLLAKGVPNLEGYHANYQDADETDWFYHYAAYAHANNLLEVSVLTSSQKGQIKQFFSLPRTMKAGDQGEQVKQLKNALYQLGLYNDNKSNNFDLALTRALTKFQVAHRLRATGELDEPTRLALLNEEVIIKKVSYFIPQKPLTRSELARLLYRLGR